MSKRDLHSAAIRCLNQAASARREGDKHTARVFLRHAHNFNKLARS